MLYLSEVLNLPIIDSQNRTLGRVADLTARPASNYPRIALIKVRTGRRSHRYISWEEVMDFESTQIILSRRGSDLTLARLQDEDILLAKNVLDKQIVDLEDRKLVRVQDVQLARMGRDLQVLGVDISTSALVRRLGFRRLADAITRRYPPPAVEWRDVNLTDWRDPNLKLRLPKESLKRLHPADLAEIAASLSIKERRDMLDALPDELAADTVEEMSPELQVSVLNSLDDREASELVEEMDPDDAADLLADLPEERVQGILALLPRSESRELRSLLSHEEESAGGLMTPEYLSVRPDTTAREVVEKLRASPPVEEHSFYIYVTDEGEHLQGVFSLRDLILADPGAAVRDFMTQDLVCVSPETKQDEVVRKIMKYNLKALPVVDDQNKLKGIVTVDDAIDLVGPEDWRREGRWLS
jgi:magnesium transporter